MTQRYCTLPGQTPVRLTSLDGNIIIIGEDLRDIPEQFILDARAAGCLTEDELATLKARLLEAGEGQTFGAPVTGTLIDFPGVGLVTTPTLPGDSTNNGFTQAPGTTVVTDRATQIKDAVAELINVGNAADFTSAGVPKVEILQEKLGFNITAAERDTAFEAAKG